MPKKMGNTILQNSNFPTDFILKFQKYSADYCNILQLKHSKNMTTWRILKKYLPYSYHL